MTVFANGLEVSAKAQGCKVIAAFPDTCFTPPQTPATPPGVPIPYPNFARDSDLTSGTGTVKIGGKEVSQENGSKFSKVSGDEAGCAPKKGIITSNNRGAAYAKKWSMDVKAEGKGVVRFSDLATTNHASEVGDDAPWIIGGTISNSSFVEAMKCAELSMKILARVEELEERYQDMLDDPYDLFLNHKATSNRHPKPGVGSWDGHSDHQYKDKQKNLRKMLQEYSSMNCLEIDYVRANNAAYRDPPKNPARLNPRRVT